MINAGIGDRGNTALLDKLVLLIYNEYKLEKCQKEFKPPYLLYEYSGMKEGICLMLDMICLLYNV